MGRTRVERKRIYRETVDRVLDKYRLSKTEFNKMMGHGGSWYGTTFNKGYYDISTANLRLWAFTIGCTEEELTEIPTAKKTPQPVCNVDSEIMYGAVKREDLEELIAMLTDGFRMLHQDLQILTETMDKYWKPTEPKYEVKEREQP